MARLQRSAHHAHIPRAIERIIAAAVRHLDQLLLDTLVPQFRRVDEIRRAELLAPRLFPVVDVHDDDLRGPVLDRALDDRQPDAAGAEDGDVGSRFHARGHDCGAVACRDAAAEQASAVHGRFVRDRDDGDVGHDGVLREGGGAHEVQEVLAAGFEARGAVWHHAFALGGADLAAEVGLAGFAEFAFAAFGCAGVRREGLLAIGGEGRDGWECRGVILECDDIVAGLD